MKFRENFGKIGSRIRKNFGKIGVEFENISHKIKKNSVGKSLEVLYENWVQFVEISQKVHEILKKFGRNFF